MIRIRTFIGRRLNYVNGILRRQIELDRPLKNREDVKLIYEYYEKPKNPIDFFSKRFFLYPYNSKKKDKEKNTINHITYQLLGDLGLFLDKSKTIITCHDIFTFLEKRNIRNPLFLQKFYLSGLKKCRYIIAISNFTKNELNKKLKIPNDKIVVIKNGMLIEGVMDKNSLGEEFGLLLRELHKKIWPEFYSKYLRKNIHVRD